MTDNTDEGISNITNAIDRSVKGHTQVMGSRVQASSLTIKGSTVYPVCLLGLAFIRILMTLVWHIVKWFTTFDFRKSSCQGQAYTRNSITRSSRLRVSILCSFILSTLCCHAQEVGPVSVAERQLSSPLSATSRALSMTSTEVLSTLYVATTGTSWTVKTNWMNGVACPSGGWYGVTCSRTNVVELFLSGNNLQGTLPTQLGQLTAMTTNFAFVSNTLTGSIPSELGQLSALHSYFGFYRNSLSGSVPSQLGQLTSMTYKFYLYSNQLSGSSPSELGLLTGMTSNFHLRRNKLTSSIPSEIGQLTLMDYYISWNGNSFTGSIPSELGQLTGMAYGLSFESNKLSGTLPSEVGLLTSMTKYFNLWNNKFTSYIPSEIGQVTKMVHAFSLSENSFTGPIPSELGLATSMTYGLWFEYNSLSGTIPSELGMMTALTNYFSLSFNELSGSIPSQLGLLTKMKSNFDLNFNNLCDAVPIEVSALSSGVSGWDINTANSLGTPCCVTLPASYTCSPTSSPTLPPTPRPSIVPSPHPTNVPTLPPTPNPTFVPTYSPTVVCLPGYSFDGSRTCTACTSGKYTNFTGTPYPQTCELCPAGQYNVIDGSVGCLQCASGKLSSADRTQCTDCKAGEYSLNASECVECASGYYAPQALSDSCITCPAGSHTNKNVAATTCTACDAGKYSSRLSVNCSSCDLGRFSGSGASQCSECAKGFIASNAGSSTCTACPVGRIAASTSSSNCTACSTGRYQGSTGQSECTPCSAGEISDRTGLSTCTACSAGKIAATVSSSNCSDCPKGRYQGSTGQDTCDTCEGGKYASSIGTTSCLSCEGGKYSNVNTSFSSCWSCMTGTYSNGGSSDCLPCSAGTIAPRAGISTCISCAAGKIAANASSSNCSECPVGRYQGSTGQSECDICDAGKYSDQLGSTSCSSCDGGEYSNVNTSFSSCWKCSLGRYSASRASHCLPCAAGTIAPRPGMSTCTACSAGKIAATASASNCTDCPVGRYQGSTGQQACLQCETGKYSNDISAASCSSCDPGKFSYEGAQSCDIADEDYYLTPYLSDSGDRIMQSCPSRTKCSGGTSTPIPDAGYWIDHSDVKYLATTYRCSRLTCKSGDNSSGCWDIKTFNKTSCKNVQCSEGASGPMCGACDTNYVYSTITNACEGCDAAQTSAYIVLGGVAVITVVSCFLFYFLAHKFSFLKKNPLVEFFSHIESGSLKVLWVTYQIIVSISFTVDVKFPYPFSGMLGLLSVFSFDFLSFECLNTGANAYYQAVYLWSLLPIVAASMIVLAGVFRLNRISVKKTAHKESFAGSRKKVISQHVWLMLFLSYLILPPVSNKHLQSFDCIELDSGARYLRVDTSINCESGDYAEFILYNTMFLIIYQCIPVIWISLLYRNRAALNPSTTQVDEKLGRFIRDRDQKLAPLRFLFSDYKCSKWWFEVVDMYRRITFIGILPLVSPQSAIRSSFGMILSLISVAYIREEQPYSVEFTNVIAHIAQLSILATFYFALSIETGVMMSFGLEGRRLGVFLIIANLAIITLALAFAWTKLKHERALRMYKEWKASFTEDARGFSANKFNTTFESIWKNSIPSSNVLVFHYTTVKEAKEARQSGIKAQQLFSGVPVSLRQPHAVTGLDFDVFSIGDEKKLKFPNEEVLVLSLPRKLLEPLPGYEDDDGLYVLPSRVLSAMRPTMYTDVQNVVPWFDGLILLPPQCIIRCFKILSPGAFEEKVSKRETKAASSSTSHLKVILGEYDDPFHNSVKVKPLRSIEEFYRDMQRIRSQAEQRGLVPLYHYTSPFVAPLIINGGLRMSTQGQGDGGVYVSTQGPASYGIGKKEYEFNIIKDCFGVERIEEYRGKGYLDVILVYASEPAVFDQAPGGRDNAKMVTKTSFGCFSLKHPDGNLFLRPDRVLGAFQVVRDQLPRLNSDSERQIQSELVADSDSVEKLNQYEVISQQGLTTLNAAVDKYWSKKEDPEPQKLVPLTTPNFDFNSNDKNPAIGTKPSLLVELSCPNTLLQNDSSSVGLVKLGVESTSTVDKQTLPEGPVRLTGVNSQDLNRVTSGGSIGTMI